ncbi:TRAFAC clade GTPase domain-containing protein [Roseimaritima ulvae]|uniref:Double-GTPase 1 domain-containing protein n=1 Tax=Roseimaritima ulvae TaxID=980254 RepID=A0A5B9QTG5_9BACT|nr:hypothetical protein [Roseimaritima ulvae]QEG41040.1 hypothetical protein UC8_30580 [Roseimaritima ulvae]
MITTPHQLLSSGRPALAINCACCEQRLPEGQEFCSECQTPAVLSQTVATRSGEKNFVSVLGASNAGKTVYLGLLLDILSNGSEEFRGTTTSAFSIDLQEQVISALEKRTFPEKTPSEADSWKWMHCQISMAEKKARRYVDLISPDFAGEAIAMEVNHAGMYPAISHVVSKSSGLLILCDSMRVRDEGSGEDIFALKLASYIAAQHGLSGNGRGRRSASSSPAVAIVFTKCDGCSEAIGDPALFASHNTPRLFEFCKRTFSRHAFFAASVAGRSGMLSDSSGRGMRFPFHIQPQGVIEPLRWLVGK